jgi:hypothetical protein
MVERHGVRVLAGVTMHAYSTGTFFNRLQIMEEIADHIAALNRKKCTSSQMLELHFIFAQG